MPHTHAADHRTGGAPPPASAAPAVHRSRGPRVLLLDSGWAATPYVAAALTRAGCTVHAFSEEDGDTRFAERYFTRTMAPPAASAEYLPALGAVVRSGAFDHVLPLSEDVLRVLWAAPPAWEGLVYPRTEPWQRAVVGNKRLQMELATRSGVEVPEFLAPSDERGVARAVEALGLPVVVKGVDSAGGKDVHIATSYADALRHWQADGGVEPPLLQRYVHGPTLLVGGLFLDGEPLRLYAAEKSEMYPPDTGPSIRLRTVDDRALIDPALVVFRALRWTGVASADLMRGADGRYRFLEVNPRPWGSVAVVEAAGVDLFTPLAELLRGGTPAAHLDFATGVDRLLFPQYMQARVEQGTVAALVRALCDVRAWRAAPWRFPGLVLHFARWPWRSWRRARRSRATASGGGGMA
jgi:biotin carboxylase